MTSSEQREQPQPEPLIPDNATDTDTDKEASDMLFARDKDAPGLDYWRAHSLPPMTREQTIEAFRQWREEGNERARERIIRSNARFAINVATGYISTRRTIDELVADAIAGMLRATETFKPNAGFAFISYAVWWMRQYCRAAILDEQRVVRHPQNLYSTRNTLDRHIAAFLARHERMPSIEELVELTGLSEPEVTAAMTVALHDSSLDATVADTDGLHMADALSDDGPGPADLLEAAERKDIAARLLADLDPRLRYIVVRYYGLDGEPADTLESVARRIGITRERARQLREQAISIVQLLHGLVPVGTATGSHSADRQRAIGALTRTANVDAAARLLGVTRDHLMTLVRRYHLTLPGGYVRGHRSDTLPDEDEPRLAGKDCY